MTDKAIHKGTGTVVDDVGFIRLEGAGTMVGM